MIRTLSLAALVCLMPFVWGAGQPSSPAPAPSPERLIEQLGDEDFTRRDAAARALEALGSKALPALQKAKTHEDPEVRRRVGALVVMLERAQTLSPKRVTLKLKNRPIRQAVTEIAKQTGYKIEMWPDAASNGDREKEPHSFELENVSFWEAINAVCRSSGLVVQDGYGDDRIRLNYTETRVPFVQCTGPFRIVAQGFHYSRSINFGSLPKDSPELGQRSEYLNFAFSISVEPRLPLLGLGQARLTVAEDDRHNLMSPPEGTNDGRESRYYNGGYKSYSQHAQVNLFAASRQARKVKLLRGEVPVTLLLEQKPEIVVDKILTVKARTFKAGDTELKIESAAEQGNKQYQIKLSATKVAENNPNDYTWRNTLYQRLELQDAKGRKYQSQGYNEANFSQNGVTGSFLFGDPGNGEVGPPAKLVYYTWITMQHTVPFEFKDLPLP